tara:strand:+ start:685 stop:1095 length:411 start_codon:yes stop_codon:yes gene_type:complete
MYDNFPYPLSEWPSGGSYNKLPEIYTEWEKAYNERINREKEESETKSQANYDKFKHFFNHYGERENPLDYEYEENHEEDEDYPFSVFGLKKSSSQEDMKNAYRKAIRETHPDKTGGNTEDEFREVQEAYECYKNTI